MTACMNEPITDDTTNETQIVQLDRLIIKQVYTPTTTTTKLLGNF